MLQLICMFAGLAPAAAISPDQAQPLSALARMPVKEVTVFKDGHAFVVHEGRMPTDSAGNVPMDYLPTPVLGTFWPYSRDKAVRMSAVKAGVRRVVVKRTALALREMLEANEGADVTITEIDGQSHSGRIIGIPTRSGEELEATSPPGTGERLPEKGSVILLKTDKGTRVVPIERVRDVTLKDGHKLKVANQEFRNILTMKLEWPGGQPGKAADVGMAYVQRGIRWIPSYRVSIDGKGTANVRLQATLINEMVDLNDATANLVIGVPTFAFKDTLDPIALQQTLAQLSGYFQPGSSRDALSNSIMTQGRMGELRGGFGAGNVPQPPADLGPEVAGSDRAEDLFVFTVRHVTLKRGERMVLPVSEYTLKYKDAYPLDIPFAPPPELRPNVNTEQQAELNRIFNAPHVVHRIRLVNTSRQPFTTAPALLFEGDRLLAQGMMTYTSPGSDTELAITTATDVRVRKSEHETKRTPNVEEFQGNRFQRVDMEGVLTLTNYGPEPVTLDVRRYVLGQIDKVGEGGKQEMINVLDDAAEDHPYWWNWYTWPYWWNHFNGIGRVSWTVTIAPGKSADLHYSWHYFWQ